VGELTRAPAVAGSMLGEGVVDGDPPGTGGVSWGGSNRLRRSPGTGGLRRSNWRAPVVNRGGEVVEANE
jgi:hypothetical protein